MAETFPEYIGKYKVNGIIAKGGMGVVYKAVHPSLKRFVVIKKMTARRNSSNVERFKREAQILLDLQSPYIVHLFDYFTEGGYRYMVEELVDGMALDKILEKQVILSPQLALLILQDACYALKYAHSKDIVHRDIKPGNILISKKAEIKLADFGIASDKEQNTEEGSLTQTGVALGTPAYMPPEQFENSAQVDKRADIYALGIMLYEMVTGSKPYPGTLTIETLNTIKKGKYISPKKIDKTIPDVVCKLIKKMLQPKAKKRFQSTAPILKIIKKYLKRYDIHAIRVQLAKIVLSESKVKETTLIPKDLKARKIKTISTIILASLISVSLCWYSGILHRYLLRKWFTPISVETLMPVSASNSADLPVKVFFFENDGKDFPEVKGSQKILSEIKNENKLSKNSNYRTFFAKNIFLKPGEYRIKVVAGPYVWWQSFTVTNDEKTIFCDFLKDIRRPINVITNAIDAKSGKNITASTSCNVFYNNNWIPLSEVPTENMLSGNVWKFRFSCPGYFDEIYSLRLDWYQNELFISAKLTPKS